MRTPIYFRRGNKVDLPVLNAGEPGFAVDTKELFIGQSAGGNLKVAMSAAKSWIAPTLLNSWVNFGSLAVVGYHKDDMGYVHLKGYIGGGVVTSGTNLFTLPAGYRPSEGHRFTTHGYNGTTQVLVILSLDNTGNVSILNANSSTQIDLDIIPYLGEV